MLMVKSQWTEKVGKRESNPRVNSQSQWQGGGAQGAVPSEGRDSCSGVARRQVRCSVDTGGSWV